MYDSPTQPADADLVDVVVPCYRYGHFLRQCVQSVLEQEGPGVRVLIIDDASPDDSAEVASALSREDARVSFRRHEVNQGHIATYNEGIEWAGAECMLLLSADDYLLPGALARATALMRAHPQIGFCFGDALLLGQEGRPRRIRSNVGHRGAEPALMLSGQQFVALCGTSGASNFVPTPTAVVRTALLKRLGGYRDDLPHTGDLELWLRLAAHAPVGVVRAAQAVYRLHGQNMSIGYQKDHWLPDLMQRKEAFDAFLRSCPDSFDPGQQLYADLLRSLAKTAVGYARRAFNEHHPDLCDRLSRFALQIDPDVRRSLAWRYLACKRLLGLRNDHALSLAAGKLRRATSRLKM